MRFLVYEWSSYLKNDLYGILREGNVNYRTFEWKFRNKNDDEAFISWFKNNIDIKSFDALISINFWPLLSKVCQEFGVKYIAWCYDCPLNVERIEETLANEVNYVFLFDRMQFLKYRKAGFKTVYHLPLGVNPTRINNYTFTEHELQKYKCDVSFVGSLYESKIAEIMNTLDEYTKGYLNSMMDVQLKIYGQFFLDEMLDGNFLNDINEQYQKVCPGTKFSLSKEALSFAMASEVTRKERLILLHLCGKRYNTCFYGYHESEILDNVRKYPKVDYYTEVPRIYAASKINLNPSLKCIETGIPLRVFDILGVGGFLLTNYQAELCEWFEDGEEMVIYDSFEDAIDKIDFYLKNEEKREAIALAGKRKVLAEHTLQQRLAYIFEVAGIA